MAAAAALDAEEEEERQAAAKEKRMWMRPWLQDKHKGHATQLLDDILGCGDKKSYKNFLRLNEEQFKEILDRIAHRIKKQDTNMRLAITPEQKLTLTLKFLASGDSFKSLEHDFRIAANTMSAIIPDTCQAIVDEFMQEVMPDPRTEEDWKAIARGFSDRWQFHNCCGAIDGKHCAMKQPADTGSIYYNYKHFFSVVLMAMVDSDYRFTYVNIGAPGSCSDGGVLRETGLFKALDNGTAGLPPDEPLPGHDTPMPYAIVGDDAFALRSWLMKPHPHRGMTKEQRIFNYRLSRARRVVENAFGILSNRFRFLHKPMEVTPERAKKMIMCACVLHNFLSLRKPRQFAAEVDTENPDTHEVQPGTWRVELANNTLTNLQALAGNTSSKAGKEQREYLTWYYNTIGAVPWQDKMVKYG